MTAQSTLTQKVGNVTVIGVPDWDKDASQTLKLIAQNQFVVDFRRNLVSPPKEIHQSRYLPIGLARLVQVLNLKSDLELQTSPAADNRFRELASYLLGAGFAPIFLVDAGPAVIRIRQAIEALGSYLVAPVKGELQAIQTKTQTIAERTPSPPVAPPQLPTSPTTPQSLDQLLRLKPDNFMAVMITADLTKVAAYKRELKLKYSRIVLSGTQTEALSENQLKEAKTLESYGEVVESVENLKLKHPKLDRLIQKIASRPGPVQGRLGKIAGALTNEAYTVYLNKKGGLAHGVGYLAGKAVDLAEDKVFVRTLKTHTYDEYGRRRFRPFLALQKKIYNLFHVQDPSGKMRFRPTYTTRKSLAQSRVGRGGIGAFRKVSSPFLAVRRAIGGTVGKFLRPLAKLGGRILATWLIAKTLIKLAWQVSKKVLKWVGGAALGLYYYFITVLGAWLPVIIGATVGLLAGGTIGAVAGAIIGAKVGFTIGATIGTFIAPGFGTAVGGIIGGAVGAVTGAVIGGSFGALIGTAIGGTVGYIYAGHWGGMATLSGAGVGAGVGFVLGGPPGAVVGALVGGAAGYAVGEYVIPGVKTAAKATGGAIASATGGVGGFFTAIGKGIAAAGQTVWGAATAGAGWVAGATEAVTGFLSSVTVNPAISAIPVGGVVVGTPAVVLFVGITTGAGFFNPYQSLGVPQKSEFITVVKTASPTRLEVADLPANITFTIDITAKVALTEVICLDQVTRIKSDGSSQTILEPEINCDSDMTRGSTFSFGFPVTIEDTTENHNATIANRITVQAQVEGEGLEIAQADAVVVIGTPPIGVDLPSDWPTTGGVTQGPNTSFSHSGLEAIDIGAGTGTDVCATHSGIAIVTTEGNTGPYGTTGLGNYIMIRTADGAVSSFYGHLSSFEISDGTTVTSGTKIGEMGVTGPGVTGPHLHYEFWGVPMGTPYIPEDIPSGTWSSSTSPYQTNGC